MQRRTVQIPYTNVLWADHQSENDILTIRDTTQPHIWETTYQGHPTSPKGQTFQREWWGGMRNRFTSIDQVSGFFISADTAGSKDGTMSAITTFGLWLDYRIGLVDVWSDRVPFEEIRSEIIKKIIHFKQMRPVFSVIIENKASGGSLIQSLQQTAEDWMVKLIYPYNPKVGKEERWGEAAVWCNLDMVMLPAPSPSMPWLADFERDLYEAPDVAVKDRLDAFAQGVLFASNYLSQGYAVRTNRYG